jgi:chaperonin GroES
MVRFGEHGREHTLDEPGFKRHAQKRHNVTRMLLREVAVPRELTRARLARRMLQAWHRRVVEAGTARFHGPTDRRLNVKIRPLQDRVIVRRVKAEEKTKGGLIIPDTAKEKPVEAVVLAVGNGKVLEDGTVRKLDVVEGDRVLFGKYTGSEVKLDGEDALILREEDILGVIEG